MNREMDLGVLDDALRRWQVGVDDLLFAVHLGAGQIARSPAHPPSTRAHWRRVAEDCRRLWQDHSPEGIRLNPLPRTRP